MLRWFRIRSASLAPVAAWLAAFALHGAAPALSFFVPAPASPVEAAAIVTKKSEALACHHHPQGCPADCFCPREETGAGEAAPAGGTFGGGAAWAQCTEGDPVSAPQFATCLMPAAARAIGPVEAGRVHPARFPRAGDPFSELPAKVPIAGSASPA